MYPHRIRLRGPWQVTPLGNAAPPARVAAHPCRWSEAGLGEFHGSVRHLRRFGIPRRLDDFETVWLLFDGFTGAADIALNGSDLLRHCTGAQEIEITGQLQPRNTLEITLTSDAPDAGLWGEVALEIRRRAWLRNLRLEIIGERLRLSGDVRGRADSALDLYLIAGRRTLLQASVTPGDFEAWSDDPVSDLPSAGYIDLVQGSDIWFRADLTQLIQPQGIRI